MGAFRERAEVRDPSQSTSDAADFPGMNSVYPLRFSCADLLACQVHNLAIIAVHRVSATPDRRWPAQSYKKAAEEAYLSGPVRAGLVHSRVPKLPRGFPSGVTNAGFALPVHYPCASVAPPAEGKNYEWFVGNDRTGRDTAGPAVALNSIADLTGLPIIGGG